MYNFGENNMKSNVKTKMIILISLGFFFMIFFLSWFNFPNYTLQLMEKNNNENVYISAENHFPRQWIKNPTFEEPIESTWFSTIFGDDSDVSATSGSGQANFVILGDSNAVMFDDPIVDGNWVECKNPEIPMLPDGHEINSSGCCVYHYWDEFIQDIYTSVHWKKNFTMPVNMSDYMITSASLKVLFNASVITVPHDGGGIEVEGDFTTGPSPGDPQFEISDFVNFYVLISDLEKDFSIQVANYRPIDLGRDDPSTPNITDTLMNTLPEDALINLLTTILEKDYYNFTITLGIDIFCKDNDYGLDIDYWKSLIIKSFNLTLTYKKKMNQLTTVSWSQVGNQLSGDNLQITNAKLNFMYKIDQIWPNVSKNSEIRILINGMKHSETIKINTANISFKDAKLGGFDVTNLIQKNLNISTSIQVYLADNFVLDNIFIISIDDVSLEISYNVLRQFDEKAIISIIIIIIISFIILIISLLILLFVVKPKIHKHVDVKKKTSKAKADIENFEYNIGNFIKNKLINYYEIKNWEKGIPIDIITEIQNKVKKERTDLTIDTIELLDLTHLLTIILEENNWTNIFCEVFSNKQIIKEKFENLRNYKNRLYQGTLNSEDLDKYIILIQAIRTYFIKGLNVFFSYSTSDTNYYRIAEIANRLENYSEIEKVFYWEEDSGENIVEYMEQTMQLSKAFVLFCSSNSLKSKAVGDEWQAAFQLRKKGTMKIIPVYENEAEIPLLLGHLLNVKFNRENIDGFVEKLYKEIMR